MAAGGVSLAAQRTSIAAPKSAPRASKGLLDEIERRACRYFYDMAAPDTGLVRDRATAEEPYAPSASSIAATGFRLSALAIADSRRYLEPGRALNRARRTASALCHRAAQQRGFRYHFLGSSG